MKIFILLIILLLNWTIIVTASTKKMTQKQSTVIFEDDKIKVIENYKLIDSEKYNIKPCSFYRLVRYDNSGKSSVIWTTIVQNPEALMSDKKYLMRLMCISAQYDHLTPGGCVGTIVDRDGVCYIVEVKWEPDKFFKKLIRIYISKINLITKQIVENKNFNSLLIDSERINTIKYTPWSEKKSDAQLLNKENDIERKIKQSNNVIADFYWQVPPRKKYETWSFYPISMDLSLKDDQIFIQVNANIENSRKLPKVCPQPSDVLPYLIIYNISDKKVTSKLLPRSLDKKDEERRKAVREKMKENRLIIKDLLKCKDLHKSFQTISKLSLQEYKNDASLLLLDTLNTFLSKVDQLNSAFFDDFKKYYLIAIPMISTKDSVKFACLGSLNRSLFRRMQQNSYNICGGDEILVDYLRYSMILELWRKSIDIPENLRKTSGLNEFLISEINDLHTILSKMPLEKYLRKIEKSPLNAKKQSEKIVADSLINNKRIYLQKSLKSIDDIPINLIKGTVTNYKELCQLVKKLKQIKNKRKVSDTAVFLFANLIEKLNDYKIELDTTEHIKLFIENYRTCLARINLSNPISKNIKVNWNSYFNLVSSASSTVFDNKTLLDSFRTVILARLVLQLQKMANTEIKKSIINFIEKEAHDILKSFKPNEMIQNMNLYKQHPIINKENLRKIIIEGRDNIRE